jgi:hypothetical protein
VKLPAAAIAASFVCGILLGLSTWLARANGSHSFLLGCCAVAGVSIVAGLVLLRLHRLALSATASLLAWVALGILSAGIAQQPLPSDHVVRLVDGGQLDLHCLCDGMERCAMNLLGCLGARATKSTLKPGT